MHPAVSSEGGSGAEERGGWRRMKVYSESDIGLMRNSNQDYCKTGNFSDDAAWAVVCDGMGGANGGCTASSLAAETISGITSERLQRRYDLQRRSGNLWS